ncbi:hypothetical protein QBC46DRAFT_336098 [Diplogelasinospora grovesii]|uniref:Uncharacterized protein n=1 Tax=Diplogelasinospora grovesii TaxID=303347 RepID=A0AAN6SAE2_9PEZI|nr:hypothetical protein QBC46DRAFT_336098 [Diplogelasinospora grovesii]
MLYNRIVHRQPLGDYKFTCYGGDYAKQLRVIKASLPPPCLLLDLSISPKKHPSHPSKDITSATMAEAAIDPALSPAKEESILDRKIKTRGLAQGFSSNLGRRKGVTAPALENNGSGPGPVKSSTRVKAIVDWLEKTSSNYSSEAKEPTPRDFRIRKHTSTGGTISGTAGGGSLNEQYESSLPNEKTRESHGSSIPSSAPAFTASTTAPIICHAVDHEEYSLTLLKYKSYFNNRPLARCLDDQEEKEGGKTSTVTKVEKIVETDEKGLSPLLPSPSFSEAVQKPDTTLRGMEMLEMREDGPDLETVRSTRSPEEVRRFWWNVRDQLWIDDDEIYGPEPRQSQTPWSSSKPSSIRGSEEERRVSVPAGEDDGWESETLSIPNAFSPSPAAFPPAAPSERSLMPPSARPSPSLPAYGPTTMSMSRTSSHQTSKQQQQQPQLPASPTSPTASATTEAFPSLAAWDFPPEEDGEEEQAFNPPPVSVRAAATARVNTDGLNNMSSSSEGMMFSEPELPPSYPFTPPPSSPYNQLHFLPHHQQKHSGQSVYSQRSMQSMHSFKKAKQSVISQVSSGGRSRAMTVEEKMSEIDAFLGESDEEQQQQHAEPVVAGLGEEAEADLEADLCLEAGPGPALKVESPPVVEAAVQRSSLPMERVDNAQVVVLPSEGGYATASVRASLLEQQRASRISAISELEEDDNNFI